MNDPKAQAAHHPDQPPGENPMTTNQERAAEVIDEWQCDNTSHGTPEQLAQALADAGLLREELPEPDSRGIWRTGISTHNSVSTTPAGEVHLGAGNVLDRSLFINPDKARRLARILDAAAKYAEEGK